MGHQDFLFGAVGPGYQIVPPGAQDQTFREIGNVFVDPTDEAYPYKLTYSAYAGAYDEDNVFIFGAKSADGETWVKTGKLHARSGEDPYVVMDDDGIYHMFCEDKPVPLPGRGIRRYTAENFDGPWTDRGVALAYIPGHAWEGRDVSSPVVFRDGGMWHMFYEARSDTNSGSINLASAASLAGPWVKSSKNPIIPGYAANGALGWSMRNVPNDIAKVGNTYYLTAHGLVRNHNTVSYGGTKDVPAVLMSEALDGGWRDAIGEPVSHPRVSNPSDIQIIGTLMFFPREDRLDVLAADWSNGLRRHATLPSIKNVFRRTRDNDVLNMPAATWMTVDLPIPGVDTFNGWDAATSSWTCEQSGFYDIKALVSLTSSPSAFTSVRVLINGSEPYLLGMLAANAGSFTGQQSDTLYLMAGDTVALQAYCSTGNTGAKQVRARMSITKS